MNKVTLSVVALLLTSFVISCKSLANQNQEQLLAKGLIWSKSNGELNNHRVSDSLYQLYSVGDKIETYKLYGLTKKQIFKTKK